MNKLEDFTKVNIIKDKTGVEGGYVNHKADRGGETNHGITRALADDYKEKLVALFRWDGTMMNLSEEMAFWLYDTHFWKRMKGDELLAIHPLIADKCFDVCINSGVTQGIKNLQLVLNLNNNSQKLYSDVGVDGLIGRATLQALASYVRLRGSEGIERLIVMLLAEQGGFYSRITQNREANEAFYYGWAGRVARDMKIYSKILWG